MPQPRQSGFAMLDVLVALLLLAVTLTGACSTLVQAMRATQEGWRTRGSLGRPNRPMSCWRHGGREYPPRYP